MAHFLEDCPSWRVPGTPWTVHGHSRAGERTGFMIASLRLFFDAGVNSYKHCEHILLSHSHSDHSFQIPCLAMGQGELATRPLVHCPAEMVAPLELLCRASQSLNDCTELTDALQIRPHGVAGGDEFEIAAKKTRLHVRVVQCTHRVPSVGFVLSEVKQRLRAELRGLPGAEIARRRKAGEAVTEETREPRMAFLGDTTEQVFADWPELLRVPVVFVECTAIGRDFDVHDRGHSHWDNLKPIVQSAPETTFVLIHFSRRFTDAQILEYFTQPENAEDNVVLWLDIGVTPLASAGGGAAAEAEAGAGAEE